MSDAVVILGFMLIMLALGLFIGHAVGYARGLRAPRRSTYIAPSERGTL